MLYIVVDDLRNELGYTNKNPNIISPNIDALAAAGPSSTAPTCSRACTALAQQLPQRPPPRHHQDLELQELVPRHDQGRDLLSPGSQNGWMTSGMGKVYHPGHPPKDDYPQSWSTDWPYFSLRLRGQDGGPPGLAVSGGMSTDTGVQRIADFRAKIDAAKAAGDTPLLLGGRTAQAAYPVGNAAAIPGHADLDERDRHRRP